MLLFKGGVELAKLYIDPDLCIGCGACTYVCSTNALLKVDEKDVRKIILNIKKCTECQDCEKICPTDAFKRKANDVQILKFELVKCSKCGKSTEFTYKQADRALNTLLEKSFKESIRDTLLLCNDCKRELVKENLLRSLRITEKRLLVEIV